MEEIYMDSIIGFKEVTVSGKGQIVIPKELRRTTFPEGSQAVVVAYTDHMEIRPLSYVLEKMECALMSENAFAQEWDTPEEDKAWENLLEHAAEYQHKKKD
jgi:bifunctional DNA-binding transcriptional regulator/antitoxin component of YhaV-PrlF toxin-antitoxin module